MKWVDWLKAEKVIARWKLLKRRIGPLLTSAGVYTHTHDRIVQPFLHLLAFV